MKIWIFVLLHFFLFCQEEFEGSFTVTIPGNRILDTIDLGIQFESSKDIVSEEVQKAEKGEKVIQVGIKPLVKIKKNRGKVRLQSSQNVRADLWFYLHSPAQEVRYLLLEPSFYNRGEDFATTGITDSVFSIEVFEVNSIGLRNGKLLKRLENLAFHLQKENRIDLYLKVTPGKKLAFRLYSQGPPIAHSLHLASNEKGTWPSFYVVDGKSAEVFNLPVKFVYARETRKENQPMVFRSLARQINEYVRSSSKFGTDEVVEIPVTLKMRLAPEGQTEIKRVIVGPPPSPRKQSDSEKKKGFFGF